MLYPKKKNPEILTEQEILARLAAFADPMLKQLMTMTLVKVDKVHVGLSSGKINAAKEE